MQRILIILLPVVFSLKSNGQHFDLIARASFINTTNYSLARENINTADDNTTLKASYYVVDIVAEKTNAKDIVHRFRAGINRSYAKSVRALFLAFDGSSQYITTEEDRTTYDFAIGIGKEYDFDYKRISFKIGVELPVRIGARIPTDVLRENLDSLGKQVDATKIHSDEPRRHSIGINAFANLYVRFWKSFSIGAELVNGFMYSKTKGKYDVTYEYYDANGNLTGTDIQKDELNWGSFSTSFFNPYIGLSYRF